MKIWGDRTAHVLLGAIFVVFGLNGFLNFIPMPEMSESAGKYMGGLAGTGYFFPFLKIVEIVCGALILLRLFVPLALVVLAPIVIQIVLFHLFLDLGGLPMAVLIVVLQAYLGLVVYRSSFDKLLQAKP